MSEKRCWERGGGLKKADRKKAVEPKDLLKNLKRKFGGNLNGELEGRKHRRGKNFTGWGGRWFDGLVLEKVDLMLWAKWVCGLLFKKEKAMRQGHPVCCEGGVAQKKNVCAEEKF